AQLRQRGVYLITGGLGSMGLAFARYLAEQARARLILTGRAGLPPREEWESLLSTEKANGKGPEIQDKIRKIREMEGLGSEVLVFSADVSDFDQMQRVVSEASDRFGKIDGVIHTAGTLGQGLIHLKKREDAASVLAPKMKGAMVVDELLKGAGLDFFILCSSISSVMPLIGQADYCAANAFLDAFAHYRSSREEARTISIDWGYWQELGISENALMPAAFKRRLEEAASDKEMSKAGVTVFDRILSSCSAPQIIVSPDDIKSRGEWIKSLAVSAASDGQQGRALSSHPRPGLASDYAPPVNEVERKLAGIWQDLFGIEQIGIHDNFFELGGDSLLGLQTISRMREAFNVTLPLQSFFNAPTIAGISQELEKEQRSTREQKAPAIKPVPREAYRMKRSLIADAVSVKIPDNG
ncbi:MAG TPA: SDR family NAD(P)-dependent oxidoreductase, partial [Blastocatellia bacterium]